MEDINGWQCYRHEGECDRRGGSCMAYKSGDKVSDIPRTVAIPWKQALFSGIGEACLSLTLSNSRGFIIARMG
jgi:hypothetical protein